MKRFFSLILLLCLTLSGVGCTGQAESTPRFYYLRTYDTIAYGSPDAIVAPSTPQIPEGMELDAILQLYLDGSAEENLYHPIPKGTYLLSTILREDLLVVVLSQEFSTLDGVHLTLAGACLTATCRELTGLDRVQVRSGENIYEFNYQDYIFLDDSTGK